MELDKRVNTLEQELKILKNQIQKTLLDIQEQLLTNHYPSLRTEDAAAQGANGAGASAPEREWLRSQPQPTAEKPVVRRITLDEARDAETAVPGTAVPETAAASNPLPVNDDSFDAWAVWVEESVQKFGLAQTHKLVQIRRKSGSISARVADMLKDILSLYDELGESETGGGRG